MRRGHLIVIFSIFLFLMLLNIMTNQSFYDVATEQKRFIDDALLFSADAAAEQVALDYGNENTYDYLVSAEDAFFRALKTSLGTKIEYDDDDILNIYVPLLVLVDTDGFYLNYLMEGTVDGAKSLERGWTECQPYVYSDEHYVYRFFLNDDIYIMRKSDPADVIKTTYTEAINNPSLMTQLSGSVVFASADNFQAVKRATIAECIERGASRVINEHNFIASQYGVNVYYSVPSFFESYTPALEYPSFLAVFQGYPLSERAGLYYNNCTSSAAYITKAVTYTLELSNSITQPFTLFHKTGCSYIGASGMVQDIKVSEEVAVKQYGAYACPHCFTEADGVAILP